MTTLRALAVALAIVSGLTVLLDRFVSHPLVDAAASTLVDWAVLLAALALLAGLLNLALWHSRQVARPTGSRVALSRRLASLALVVILLITLAAGLLHPQGPASPLSSWLFQFLQAPLQATLFSLLAFYLLSASYRALRPGGPLGRWGMLVMLAATITMLAQLPGEQSDWLLTARAWLVSGPTLAAVRGVLLGIALGAAVTGLRVVLGLSRPYAPGGRGTRNDREVEP